jgi:hypothetical protein
LVKEYRKSFFCEVCLVKKIITVSLPFVVPPPPILIIQEINNEINAGMNREKTYNQKWNSC